MSEKSFSYSAQSIGLQRRFGTDALAAAELQSIVHTEMTETDQNLVRGAEMFWLASVDADGCPTVSFKGGAPGFVRVSDSRTLLFPSYDGNGMFHSMGNIEATGSIGMLFMNLEQPTRLRVHGSAVLVHDEELVALWPGAELVVMVGIHSLVTNCPRYIPKFKRLEASRYVPKPGTGEQPLAGWKRIDTLQGVLRECDKVRVQQEGELITGAQWRELVKAGDSKA